MVGQVIECFGTSGYKMVETKMFQEKAVQALCAEETSVTGIRYRQKASTSDVGVVTGTSTGSTLASPRTETLASSSPIPNRCVRAIPRITAPLAHQP